MKKLHKTLRFTLLFLSLCLATSAFAQYEITSEDIPPQINEYSGELYDNLKLMQERYYKSLVSFKMIITKNKVSKRDFQTFFFQDLLGRLEDLADDLVPGLSSVKKTVIGFLEEDQKGKADRKKRSAHDWIEKEIDDLNKSFEHVNRSKLALKFAKEFYALPDGDAQEAYIKAIKVYSDAVSESVPSYAAAEIEVYENWINQNFKRKGQMSQGVLLSIIKLTDDGYSKIKLAVRTPYGEEIATRLNKLLESEKKRPFDLKVYKLILISPSSCGSCADSAFLTRYNQVLKKPSYRPALKVFNEIKSRSLRDDLMLRTFSG